MNQRLSLSTPPATTKLKPRRELATDIQRLRPQPPAPRAPREERRVAGPAPVAEILAALNWRCSVGYTGRDQPLINALRAAGHPFRRYDLELLQDAPSPYALLQDTNLTPWQYQFMGQAWVPHRPQLVILWGYAAALALPRGYAWRVVGKLTVGRI